MAVAAAPATTRVGPGSAARAAPLGLRWKAMARIGLRMMFHDRLKMLGTLAGVIFAVVLSIQQAGTFLGLMHKNTMFVRNAGADIWIVPPSTEQVQPGKMLSDAALTQARVTGGVAWAEPLVFGAASVALPGGGSEQITLIGTRAPALRGGPWNMVVGDPSVLGAPDTMIFEDSDREKLGGLNVGSLREVNGNKIQVGGFTWGLLPFGPSYAFADLELARRLMRVDPDRQSFVLVGVAPGADLGAVKAELAARVPEAKVMTRGELERSTIRFLLTRTPIGITFGTSALFGLIVGFVIVALSMFSAVVDNLREFGTLKAIGATNWDLAKLLFVQSVAYAVIGSIVGLGIVTQVADAARSPNLAIQLPPELLLGIVVVMLFLCLSASTLALLRLRKLEPAMVFR